MSEKESESPLGIKLVGALLFLTGLILLPYSLAFLRTPELFGVSLISSMVMLGLPLLSVASIVSAYGFFRMKKWGWVAALNISAIGLALDLALFLKFPEASSPGRMILTGVMVGYIFRMKDHFE